MTEWTPGPARPRLERDAVDVWRAQLDAAGDAVLALLSGEEQARAERFARAEDGRRWAAAHGILRALLGRYLGADPRALRFVAGEHGKPALSDAHSGAELRFNLSHSGAVALCAVARGRDVGVDVELPRRPLDAVALARRALGEQEARRLETLDPAARERELLRLWTRLEAALKCRGTGIGGAAPDAGAGAAGGGSAGPLQPIGASPAPWVVELDDPVPGAVAALAVDGPPCDVRCWRWDG